MVFTVRVVESAAVRRVAHSLLAHEHVAGVHQADARRAYVALEANAFAADAEGLDALRADVRLRAELNREAVGTGGEALECLLPVLAAAIDRVLGQVLHGQRCAHSLYIHPEADIA